MSFFPSRLLHVLLVGCLVTVAVSDEIATSTGVTSVSTDDNVVTTLTDGATVSIQGVWETTWNTMNLYQTGTVIVGTYEYDSGELVGELRGQVLYGWWREAGNSKSCGPGEAWSGPFVFTFDEATEQFTGDWGYCSETHSDLTPQGSTWTGSLTTRDVVETDRPTSISTDDVNSSFSENSQGTSAGSATVYDPTTDSNLSENAPEGLRQIYNVYVAAKDAGQSSEEAFETAMQTATDVFEAYGVDASTVAEILLEGQTLFGREISEGRNDKSALIYIENYMLKKVVTEVAKQDVAVYIVENGVTEANFNDTHLSELIAMVEELGIEIENEENFKEMVLGIIRQTTSTIMATADCDNFNQMTDQCMDAVYYLQEHFITSEEYNGTLTSQASKNSKNETVQLIQYVIETLDGTQKETSITLPDSSQLENLVDRYVSTLKTSLGSVRVETEADGAVSLDYVQEARQTSILIPSGYDTVLNEDGSVNAKTVTEKVTNEIAVRKDGVVWAVIELDDKLIHHMVPMEANSSTSEVLSKEAYLARQTTTTNSAQKSRALSSDDFYAVVNSFESSRNFTAFEREGEESVVVEVDSDSASFDDVVTVDEERTITLTGGEATLVNQDGSTQTMEAGTAYEVPVTEAEETDYRTIWENGEMTLTDGWNLVALPVNESVVDVQEGFGNYEVAWSYSAAHATWTKNPDSLIPGEALWIKTTARGLSFEGNSYATDIQSLPSGWNLLGVGSETEDITVSLGLTESYKYQEGSWTQNPLKTFRGQGVWVKLP